MPGSVGNDLPGRVLAGPLPAARCDRHGRERSGLRRRRQRLRRRVAVKVLHAALADDAGFLRRFRAEAQLAASLHHPNIVTVYDWGEDELPFMVLELLEGGSLRSMLDQGTGSRPAGGARRARRRVGARVRARARRAAPRRQAREPLVRRARRRARRRLRPRPRARRSELDRAGRRHARHRALRVARAGARGCSSTRVPICTRSRWCSSSRSPGTIPFAVRHHDRHAHRAHAASAASRPRSSARSQAVDRARGPARPRRPLSRRGDDAPGARRRRRSAAAARAARARGHGRPGRPAPDPRRRAPARRRRSSTRTRPSAPKPVGRAQPTGAARNRASRPGARRSCRSSSGRCPAPRSALAALGVRPGRAASRVGRGAGPRRAGRRPTRPRSPKHDGLTLRASEHAGVARSDGCRRSSQSPGSGSFTAGRSVHVVVSSGPAPVAVPAIVGQPWTKAKTAARQRRVLVRQPTAGRTATPYRRRRREREARRPARWSLPTHRSDRAVEGPRAGAGSRRASARRSQAAARAHALHLKPMHDERGRVLEHGARASRDQTLPPAGQDDRTGRR